MADTKMTKTIGEHWVCAILARLGWAPALTRDAIERTDILAVGTHLPDRPRIEVQVKAVNLQGDIAKFPLGAVAEKVAKSDHEWFILIIIPDFPFALRTFVVPRDHVCAGVWIHSQGYNRGAVWIPWDVWKDYEDRWELLGTPTTGVPVLLPKEYREMAIPERIGLPPGHPWTNDLPQW